MRFALVILVVSACSKSGADCEALRDKYIAESEANVKAAIGSVESAQKAELQAQGDKEIAMAKERFIGACKDLELSKNASCLEKANRREPRCKELSKALDHKLYAP